MPQDQSTSLAVVIESKNYIIGEPLDPADPLVVQVRRTVSQTLTVGQLITEMTRAADLLNVAHLAAASYNRIQNSIWQILTSLQEAIGRSDATMIVIGDQAGNVLSILADVFDYLFYGDADLAISTLKECADCAGRLADAAETMAAEFDGLAEKTKVVVGDAQGTTADEKARIAALAAEIVQQSAEKAALAELTKSYQAQKDKVAKLYEDAKQRAETAEERAFVSELVGGIFSAVGSGLAAYASARTPQISIGSQPVPVGESIGSRPAAGQDETDADPVIDLAQPVAGPTAGPDPEPVPEPVVPDGEVAAPAGQGGEGTPDAAATSGSDAQPASAAGVPTDQSPSQAPATTTAQSDAKAQALQQKKDAENLARTQAAAAAATNMSAKADKIAAQSASSAVELRRQVSELLNLQFEIEEKNRDALAKIAKFTVLIEGKGVEKSAIEISVASLSQSIGALQQVTAILLAAATYWRGMEAVCRRLDSEGDFQRKIERLGTMTEAQRTREFQRQNFLRAAVQYCAGWKALECIANDYRRELAQLGTQVKGYVGLHPSEENARKEATRLAQELGLDVGEALKAKEAKLKEIADAKASVAASAAA